MKVKKYIVDSLPQAMTQIKKELGKDAVIIQTRKIKVGGFLGLFRKKKIEVIAAADSTSNTFNIQEKKELSKDKSEMKSNYSNFGDRSKSNINNNTYSNTSTNKDSNMNNSGISNIYSNRVSGLSSSMSNNSDNYMSNSIDNNMNNSRVNNIYSNRVNSLSSMSNNSDNYLSNSNSNNSVIPENNSVDSIKSEVGELKNLVLKMIANPNSDISDNNYSEKIKTIYECLLKQGVNEKISASIIEQVINSVGNQKDNVDFYEIAKKEIIEMFNKNRFKSEIESDTKIVNFVGPTGVGKTTTIAKLAADKVLRKNKDVAFITSDTFRIGAVDQLKTYADIFNSPIEVVISQQDTQRAVQKFRDYDLIFMDTAGRNYKNDMYTSELSNLLTKEIKSETYLVLSLTSKYEDLVLILDQFKKIGIDKILFTKMDETYTYGSILNILFTYPYKVSYITYGQNVPDDIESFNIDKIVNAIFGGII